MENTQQDAIDAAYDLAVNLLIHGRKKTFDVRLALVETGLSEDVATDIIKDIQKQVEAAKRIRIYNERIDGYRKANQRCAMDLFLGVSLCVAGSIMVLANYSMLFGAGVLFGLIFLFRSMVRPVY